MASNERRRIDLGVFGNTTVTGLIGFLGLLVAAASALIAYLDWQGNVAERAAGDATASATPDAPRTPSGVPGIAAGSTAAAQPTSAPAEELSYRLGASPVDSRTVEVTAEASGRAQPGLTYWFVLEVDWGGGNVDYYPRRTLTGSSSSFEISIPPDADPEYTRRGRVYGLTDAQDTTAAAKVEAQGTTRQDDYFGNATGRVVSNVVTLPF